MIAFAIPLMALMVGFAELISPVLIVKSLLSILHSTRHIALTSFIHLNKFLLPIQSSIYFSYLHLLRLSYHRSLLLEFVPVCSIQVSFNLVRLFMRLPTAPFLIFLKQLLLFLGRSETLKFVASQIRQPPSLLGQEIDVFSLLRAQMTQRLWLA